MLWDTHSLASPFESTLLQGNDFRKVYNKKYLVNFGPWRVGATSMVALILSKASFSTYVHLNWTSFFIIYWRGLTIWEKSRINLLTKLIVPKKDCIDLFLCGVEICIIALVRSGSTEIPSLEIICPDSLPSETTKMIISGFREIPYFLHLFKICFRCYGWSALFFE